MVTIEVLDWDGLVHGLGAAGAEMPLWSGSLAGSIERAAAAAGMIIGEAVPPGEDGLVVAGGTALGPRALRAALDAGRAEGRDVGFRLGARLGELVDQVDGGAGPAIWYLAPGDRGGSAGRLPLAARRRLDPEERLVALDLPGRGFELPVSDRLVLRVRHWIELLWANLLGLGPALWRELLGPSAATSLPRLAWASARAGSFRPERIAGRLRRCGPGARIHPSAVVEASALGPGARVGAGAVVRGCLLGEGAVVEELAFCEASVLGPGAVVQRQAMARFSVLGAGAAVGDVAQLAVLGPGAALKRGAVAMDQGLGGRPVRVDAAGGLRPVPLGVAGACLGPGTVVGSGVWIAPGRALPAGVAVVSAQALLDPARPAGGDGQVLVVRDGRLERS